MALSWRYNESQLGSKLLAAGCTSRTKSSRLCTKRLVTAGLGNLSLSVSQLKCRNAKCRQLDLMEQLHQRPAENLLPQSALAMEN